MIKQEKALIGIFVIGALVLLIVSVVIFGSGRFFKKTRKFVIFFDTSIKGLNIGSPVMFRGVRVGRVSDIKIIVSDEEKKIHIPVFIEISEDDDTGVGNIFGLSGENIDDAIENGLRAQLQIQSFVTGQLLIALDFFPNTPITLLGYIKDYTEIPAVPTKFEEIERTFADLPIKEMVIKLDKVLDGIERLVNSDVTYDSLNSFNATLNETHRLVKNFNTKIEPLMNNLNNITVSADKTLKVTEETLSQAKRTMDSVEKDVGELINITRQLSKTTTETLQQANSTLRQSEKTLETFSGDSPLIYQLNTLLRELSYASVSIRNLSDYLERHPEAILRGKKHPN